MKFKKVILFIFIFIVLINIFTPTCYSNSAMPPSIVIIVTNPPKDLEVNLWLNNTCFEQRITKYAFENHYAFYHVDFIASNDYVLKVKSGSNNFEVPFEEPINSYENIYTLDLHNRKIIKGELLLRSIILVSLRIIFTLLIEAGVFFIFGFRNKKSWITFLIVNLVTQGGLNIYLDKLTIINGYYIIFALIYSEILILLLEAISFTVVVKEHGWVRRFTYAIVANIISLFVGGILLEYFPV